MNLYQTYVYGLFYLPTDKSILIDLIKMLPLPCCSCMTVGKTKMAKEKNGIRRPRVMLRR